MSTVKVGENIVIGDNNLIALMAGPCVIEDRDQCMSIARSLKEITARVGIPFIFKASYDKANRSSVNSYRGPGLEPGLEILAEIKSELGVPVISDIHEADDAAPAAEVLDILQIPAFLCRQTDLILAAARTGKPVNVKKGQFLAPWDMRNVVDKIRSVGSRNIILTERGVSYGYNNLVVDMRSLPIMASLGYPVAFDVTHSLQLPGGLGTSSGGQREYIPHFARAGVAIGIHAIFMEVHPDPEHALSDGPNMVALDELEALLVQIVTLDRFVKQNLPDARPR